MLQKIEKKRWWVNAISNSCSCTVLNQYREVYISVETPIHEGRQINKFGYMHICFCTDFSQNDIVISVINAHFFVPVIG